MRRLAEVFLVFLVGVTGFSALLYQVIWERMLNLFTGGETTAVAMITAAYLGGLGVGSLVGGRLADYNSPRQALRIFGLVNLNIALWALFSPYFYYKMLLGLEIQAWLDHSLGVLGFAFLALLPPTLLMGMSLPLLARATVQSLGQAAHRITLLSGANTLGAGLGAWVTGWYLVGTLGFEVSLFVGIGLNLGVAVAVGLLQSVFSETPPVRSAPLNLQTVPRRLWFWMGAVFLSGFVFIALEIIWFRILGILIESTAYTYGHLLGLVLLSDALGTVLGGRALRWVHSPKRLFALLQGIIAVYALGSLWALGYYGGQIEGFGRTSHYALIDFEVERLRLMYAYVPMLVIVPVGLLVGFYFPVVQKAIQADLGQVGQRLAWVDSANILGNSAGGLVGGLVFLEVFGTADSLRVLGLLGAFFLLWLLWDSRQVAWLAGGLVVLGALSYVIFHFPDNNTFWRRLHGISAFADFLVEEDRTGVSGILETDRDLYFFINGENQGKMPYLDVHVMMGVLPAFLHPSPQDILVIGVGSTGTPYSAAVNPQTERVVAAEIIHAQLKVLDLQAEQATQGGDWMRQVLANERIQMQYADGRRLLLQQKQLYDVIQADAVYPWRSGAGALYSQEFFQLARSRLKPNGLMIQWIPNPRTANTFGSVFPYVQSIGHYMIGSKESFSYDQVEIINRLLAQEAYFAEVGLSLEAVLPFVPASGTYWTPDNPYPINELGINTDLFPKDEYFLNQAR